MSMYLGTIGGARGSYEIHAFTNDLPFGFFPASQVADSELFHEMLEERYACLQSGRPIFCTAVNPDISKEMEWNPHDDRPGTVHIASINKETRHISCVLSIAVDIGDTHNGEPVGLPLENRWRSNGYPAGSSLDRFRDRYPILNRDSNGPIHPWQMAELYRHVRVNGSPKDQISRLGLYVGAYHLCVLEARKRSAEETSIWVFDAIPEFFSLYRVAGAAVLRDLTIEDMPRHISPGVADIKEAVNGDCINLVYKGEVISRNVTVPHPLPGLLGGMNFEMKEVPFLDGVIDIHKVENAIGKNPLTLSEIRYQGMSDEDVDMMGMALTICAKRAFEKIHGSNPDIISTINFKRNFITPLWDFNDIGA